MAGEWKGQRAIFTPFKTKSTPATGETEGWIVKGAAPAGRGLFLLFVEHQRNKLSPWVEEQALKEEVARQGFLAGKTLQGAKFNDELLLVLMNDKGRILAQSSPHPEIKHVVGFFANSRAVPLVLDQGDYCQFALLEARAQKLFCFDLQLSFQGSVSVPLDVPMRPGIIWDGAGYSLVFLGWKFETPLAISSLREATNALPQPPQSLGAVWRVGEKAMAPLPVAPEAVWREMQKTARGPKGDTLTLQRAGIAVHPVQGLAPGETLDLLLTAVSASHFGNYARFAGVRLFFHSTLTSVGLGKVVQLPFWVVQEEERKEAEVDTSAGVLHVPAFAELDEMQVFRYAPQRLGLSLRAKYKLPKEDGSYNENVWEAARFFVSFAGTTLNAIYALDDDFRLEAAKSLSTTEVEVYPLLLRGLAGKNLFLFQAAALDRKKGRPPEDCLALMELVE